MDVFFWVIDFFLPLTLIGIGALFNHAPVKKINIACGYRTKRSMSSQKTWDYANSHFGKIYIITGAVLCIIAPVIKLIFLPNLEISTTINAVIGVFGCFTPLPIIEKQLKKLILEEENETLTKNA